MFEKEKRESSKYIWVWKPNIIKVKNMFVGTWFDLYDMLVNSSECVYEQRHRNLIFLFLRPNLCCAL